MNEVRNYAIGTLIVIGVAVVVFTFNRGKTDPELVGVWKLEWTQTNGQPPYRERELWVIERGKRTVIREDTSHSARISIDPSRSPKRFDTDLMFWPQGIYEVNGDTLRIAQAMPDSPRPTEFNTEMGDGRSVSELRRLDVDPSISNDALHALLLSEYGPEKKYPEPMEFDEESALFVHRLIPDIFEKTGELTLREQAVYHVSVLTAEVENGGFHQYFYNSSGAAALETVELLKGIGAVQTAGLLEAGCKLFPDETPSTDHGERQTQLDEFTLDQYEKLADLDQRFYSRREDLGVLLKEYWESNQ
ncbi:MAG: DUF4375 domain-containing protein [Planctomycetaceae bacterium]